MKPVLFTVDDRNAMLSALNYVCDYDDVSVLQQVMDLDHYAAIFNSVCDKLMNYCAMTVITGEEYAVLEDALVAVLPAADPRFRKQLVRVTKKVQDILEALPGTVADPSQTP